MKSTRSVWTAGEFVENFEVCAVLSQFLLGVQSSQRCGYDWSVFIDIEVSITHRTNLDHRSAIGINFTLYAIATNTSAWKRYDTKIESLHASPLISMRLRILVRTFLGSDGSGRRTRIV